MPLEAVGVNRNILAVQLDREKILEDAAIGGAFHRRQPGEFEVGRLNPTNRPELGVRAIHIYGRIGPEKPDPEIVMGLAPESPFGLTSGKLVAIGPLRFDHFVGIGRKAKLLE